MVLKSEPKKKKRRHFIPSTYELHAQKFAGMAPTFRFWNLRKGDYESAPLSEASVRAKLLRWSVDLIMREFGTPLGKKGDLAKLVQMAVGLLPEKETNDIRVALKEAIETNEATMKTVLSDRMPTSGSRAYRKLSDPWLLPNTG